MHTFKEFEKAAAAIYAQAVEEERIIHNPGPELLRRLALEAPGARETAHGSLAGRTEPACPALEATRNNLDTAFGHDEFDLADLSQAALRAEQLVCLDVLVRQEAAPVTARLILPRRFAHVAFGGAKLFGRMVNNVVAPTYQVILFADRAYAENPAKPMAEKDITVRIVHAPDGRMTKLVRNSSCLAEWETGILAGEAFRCGLGGAGVFLHGACRLDILESVRRGLGTRVSLVLGPSTADRTSLAHRILARKAGEQSWLVQDAGGILGRDGTFRGVEEGGFYVRTAGLAPGGLTEAYYGALKPDAYLENVHLDASGVPDFSNYERSAQGRAVIHRRDLMHASRAPGADRVDAVFILTSNPAAPAVARLTADQATAFLVLGETLGYRPCEPASSPEPRNVFFHNPLACGDKVQQAHLFRDILKRSRHTTCYLLNTGDVGEGEHRLAITPTDTRNIVESILRDEIAEWEKSPATGFTIPKAVDTVDSLLLRPERLFPTGRFEKRREELSKTRLAVLEGYEGLDRAIMVAIGR